MIHVEKLMLSHERVVVAFDFVLSTDHLDHTGLRVYVPDYVSEAVPPPLSADDAPDMDLFLTLRDLDAEDEDPEWAAAIARSMVEIYGP
jgi:hypothetical protein